MRTPYKITSRSLLVIWSALACGGHAAAAEANQPATAERTTKAEAALLANGQKAGVEHRANFSAKARAEYIVNGNVDWFDEQVKLQPGSEIAREFSIIPVGDLTTRLVHASPGPKDSANETWLTFAIGQNGYAGAAVVTKMDGEGKPICEIHLLSVMPDDPDKQKINVAKSTTADSIADARWQIRYNHGMAIVLRNGVELLRGDVGMRDMPVMGFRIRQVGGTSTVSQLRLRGQAAAPKVTDKDRARKAEAAPKWSEASQRKQAAFNKHDWAEVVQAAQAEHEFAQALFGPEALPTLDTLNSRAFALSELRRLDEAVTIYRDVLNTLATKVGEEHPEIAYVRQDLAAAYSRQGNLSLACGEYQQSVDICRQVLGDRHARTLYGLKRLAFEYSKANRRQEALTAYRDALAATRLTSGPDSVDAADLQMEYGRCLEQAELWQEAEQEYESAAKSLAQHLPKDHPQILKARASLASLARQTGRILRAQSILKKIERDARSGPPESRSEGLAAKLELAKLSASRGDQEEAVRLADEARKAAEGDRELSGVKRAMALTGYASVLESLGMYSRALESAQKAAELLQAQGPDAEGMLESARDQIATLLFRTGDLAAAERACREAIESADGKEGHRDAVATSWQTLGVIQLVAKHREEAAASFRKAIEIREWDAGKELELSNSYSLLAGVFDEQHRYRDAQNLYQKSLDLKESLFGTRHESRIVGLFSLAVSHQLQGDWAKADRLRREALELQIALAIELFDGLSSIEAIQLSQNLQEFRSSCLGLARMTRVLGAEAMLAAAKDNPALFTSGQPVHTVPATDVEQDYRLIWQTKSLASRLDSRRRQSSSAETPASAQELAVVRRELSALYLSTSRRDSPEERRDRLANLVRRKEELERELAAQLGSQIPSPTIQEQRLEDFAEILPDDAAIVDLIEITNRTTTITGEQPTEQQRYYDAYVLRAAGTSRRLSIEWVTLGEADGIDELLTEVQGKATLSADDRPEVKLSQRLWKPLLPLLGEAKTILIVPDGKLHTVPWAGLPSPDDPARFLIQDYAFCTAPYAQRWGVAAAERESQSGQMLLVGGVDFGKPKQGQSTWKQLPGTLAEIDAIKQFLPDDWRAFRLTSDAATRDSVVRAFQQSRWIHLATHGFYEPQDAVPASADLRDLFVASRLPERSRAMGRSPLVRCGLVFAGANQEADDAVRATLSGEEILGERLDHVELVVLSACETNVGIETGGEGLFALQRAFQEAGARAVLASLWEVDDHATSALMTEFYRNLWEEKLPRIEALRQAQLRMLNDYDAQTRQLAARGKEKRLNPVKDPVKPAAGSTRLAPYFWAGFVLSGDWR